MCLLHTYVRTHARTHMHVHRREVGGMVIQDAPILPQGSLTFYASCGF